MNQTVFFVVVVRFMFPLTAEESETYSDDKLKKIGVKYTKLECGLKKAYLSWKESENI